MKVGAYEAKTHFSQLLDRVAAGERIVITRHGVPVAVLEPFEASKKVNRAKVIEELKRFAKRHELGDISLKELIEEGRK